MARPPRSLLQRLCHRLDAVEDAGDPFLVPGEAHALGEDIGNHQQPFCRHLTQVDDAGSVDPLVAVRIDDDLRLFSLGIVQRLADDALQAAQESRFFHDLQIEHDHGAVAEQHGHAALASRDGERHHRQAVAAVEGAQVNPLADQQRVRPHPVPAFERCGQ